MQHSQEPAQCVRQDRRWRLLIIDDDRMVPLLLRRVFESDFEVISAGDGLQGLRLYHETQPDLVLLDATMPGLDGWEVLRRIREQSDTPVIMLTAREAEEDMVRGLSGGADDYVIKPYTIQVITARVNAVLRRARREPEPGHRIGRIELGGGQLVLDLVLTRVEKDGRPLNLSKIEFRLLAFLALRMNQPVRPAEILAHVWNVDASAGLDSVRTYVRLLRRKIEDDPSAPRYLVTRHGYGYALLDSRSR